MTLPPAHAINDAVGTIEDLLRDIRREVLLQESVTGPFTTAQRAAAFIGLQNNLGAALDAFRAEIGTAPRQ